MNKNSTVKTAKRLLQYIKPFRKNLILAIVSAIIGVSLSLLVPVLIGCGVDFIVAPNHVDYNGILKIALLLAIAILLSALFQWSMSENSNRVSYRTVEMLRRDVIEKLNRVPLKMLDSTAHGDIVNTTVNDVDILATGLLQGFTQFFSGLITIIGTLIFMLTVNPLITLIVVFLTPLSFFVASFIAKRAHSHYRKQAKLRGALSGYATERIMGQKVTALFHDEENAQADFEETNRELQKAGVIAHFYSALTNPCTRFVNAVIYAAVAIFGAIAAVKGLLSVGQLTAFLAYASQYTKPFNEISGVIAELQNALASADRIFKLLDEAEEPSDKALPTLTACRGDVDFENVYFAYNKQKPLIQGFSLKAESGQNIAIVGPTGCGKTTLINLLMRFYDVNRGEIRLDGSNIQSVTRQSLRAQYGMVLQDTWLFSGTIRENIAYGRPDADESEIIEAAKQAHAHSFIKRLEHGYDTQITENGDNLSAGQKQLLCIARVMLTRPPVLILDEATSSIDTRTELQIQHAFAKLMDGRTSFIVAHRLSTIRNADIILVMRDGDIVEKGTHSELLAANGFYKELYNSQFAV